MSPKPARDASKETPPPEFAASNPPAYRGTAAGFDFYLQSIVEIQKSVGSIEASIRHLSERSASNEKKLDDTIKDVHGAKKIAWAFGIIGSIIGAVGLVFLNKILVGCCLHWHQNAGALGHSFHTPQDWVRVVALDLRIHAHTLAAP
ncbi:MAG: hypothetical protein ACYDC6_10710 [Acidobacteriaceae bacterium]